MAKKKSPTIYDVAKAAGVSVTTVSRVLNNQNVVTEDIRSTVLESVDKLGYKRLKKESQSKSEIVKTIGLIIPDIMNPYYSALIKGVQNTAYRFNYQVIFCESENDPILAEKQISQLLKQNIEGLIFIPPMGFSHGLKINVPLVYLDRLFNNGESINYVGVENFQGSYNATKYLISLGHKSILYLGGPNEINTEEERLSGYLKALEDSKIDPIDKNIVECDYIWEKSRDIVLDLIEKHNFSAIFGSNDLMAFGAIEALKINGLHCPDDISVIGYDDTPFSKLLSLTSIAQPTFQLGQNAFVMLLDLINGIKKTPQEIILPTSLIIRESCKQFVD